MGVDRNQVLSDVAEIIWVVSDHIPPGEPIRMDTMLVADLAFESIEVASLFFRLQARYEGTVNLADLVTEITGNVPISDLQVGAVVEFIAGCLERNGAEAAQPSAPDRPGHEMRS
jgi:hypothetical protein